MRLLFQILFCFTISLLSYSIHAQNLSKIDSLAQKLALEEIPCQKSFLLTKMADLSKPLNIEDAITYAKKGLNIASSNNCENLGDLYSMLGFFSMEVGDHNLALSYVDTALIVYQQNQDTLGLVKTYGYISSFHYSLANYAKATSYAYKGIDLNKHIKNEDGDAQLITLLANISIGQKEYKKGLAYTKKALKIYTDENFSKDGKATLCYNIAMIYKNLQQPDSSLYFYQKALSIYKEENNVYGIVNVYLEQAKSYRNQGKIKEALNRIDEVEALRAYIPTMSETIITIDAVHGGIYQVNKEYDKAIPLLMKALKQARKIQTKALELIIINKLMQCYEAQKNFEQTLYFQRLAIMINDSIFNATKQNQIKDLEIKYATQQKEKENQLLKQEKNVEQLKVQRSRQIILGISSLLVFVLIISYLLIKNNKEKSTRKNSQLKNQLLRNQMSPHFIFNSLIAIQSFMYQNSLRESSRYLSSFAKLMRAILENSRKEYISIEQELTWLENYMKLQLLRFENKFDYKIELDEELDLYNTLIPPMLTQPFIENALEHGLKEITYKGHLTVRFNLIGEVLKIEVEDNGVGINKTKQETKEHKSLATIITKERLAYLNKNQTEKIYFDIQPTPPTGTIVSFALPLQYE